MNVSPTSPTAAASPTPQPSQSGTNSRETPSPRPSPSASGARANDARPSEPKPYRAHDHPPSADAIIANQRELTDRLDALIEKLTRVVRAADGPTAAIGSASAPAAELDRAVQREIELGKLERTIHPDGHVSYRLPLNSVRNLGYELVGKRDAFVDRGGHIEVSAAGSGHVRAATLHAARKWGNEPVVIYAEGKHLDAVIEHAVRAGLNIVNEHPTIVAKVAAERERQASPLGRERAANAARPIRQRDVAPIIARVRSETRSV